jgi:hypothetical protein
MYHLPTTTHRRREVPMPSYEEVTQRAGSLRAMTGLTATEFQALLPHFEQAFKTYMGTRTIDGQPRTSRRYSLLYNLSLTDHGRQVTLHPDLCEAEPNPGNSRTALWDVSIECQQVDSPIAHRAEPGLSRPRPPSRSYRR